MVSVSFQEFENDTWWRRWRHPTFRSRLSSKSNIDKLLEQLVVGVCFWIVSYLPPTSLISSITISAHLEQHIRTFSSIFFNPILCTTPNFHHLSSSPHKIDIKPKAVQSHQITTQRVKYSKFAHRQLFDMFGGHLHGDEPSVPVQPRWSKSSCIGKYLHMCTHKESWLRNFCRNILWSLDMILLRVGWLACMDESAKSWTPALIARRDSNLWLSGIRKRRGRSSSSSRLLDASCADQSNTAEVAHRNLPKNIQKHSRWLPCRLWFSNTSWLSIDLESRLLKV